MGQERPVPRSEVLRPAQINKGLLRPAAGQGGVPEQPQGPAPVRRRHGYQNERATEKTAPIRPDGWPYLVGSQLSLVAPTAARPRIHPFRSLVTPTL